MNFYQKTTCKNIKILPKDLLDIQINHCVKTVYHLNN